MESNDEGAIPDKYERYVLAVLFAALFASISWLAPAAYLAATPPSELVQIHSVSVNQTTNTSHNVTIDYEAREKYPVEATITLYQDQKGSEAAIETWTVSTVIPPGEHTNSLNLTTTEPPEPGLYYYEFKLRIHAGYNVQKTYVYKTDVFQIGNSSESLSPSSG